MVEARPALLKEPGDGRVRPRGLKQLDARLAHRQHDEAHALPFDRLRVFDFESERPAPAVIRPQTDRAPDAGQGNPEARVWVNTNSGVYHCPGTRWYGKTKQGAFMMQREARAQGNRPAYGSVCR